MSEQQSAETLANILEDIGIADTDPAAGLNHQQAAAFHDLMRFANGKTDHAMAVLQGWAGTGKTYLVSRLINALAGSGLSIAVAAPTNKAVRVLREKIQEAGIEVPAEPVDGMRKGWKESSWIEFGSIHSLLGLQVTERDDGTQECKSARDPSLHQYDLAIIDECSMIGSDLFSRIAIAKRTCLILFVGDPAQLPPIEAIENVSPTFSKVGFVLTLSEVVRQARDNPIIKLSMMIRQAIESDRRVDHIAISEALPPIDESPAAALVAGGFETVRDFALFEIRAGRDARVLAFTNQAVIAYNAVIHDALYGRTEFPFVPGEPVIVHSQCDGYRCNDDGSPCSIKSTLITSEEARVVAVVSRDHPGFPSIPASAVTLERDNETRVVVYVPINPFDVERLVSEKFGEWRKLKAEADEAYRCGKGAQGAEIKERAKNSSAKAWAIRRAFAPLRHAYALTAHKSQGSTFDTAIVDLNDMAKMRSAFQFNRGLYVAATRPRQYLAIVA
ncbi:MAG: hypothetical protein EOM22_11480 [Gammaproteobacteria bacterium]|nr:hypothetical protein [Gammaproteobacteria bacterium]